MLNNILINLKILLKELLPSYILSCCLFIVNKRNNKNWLKAGKPVPPPHIVKQRLVSEYAKHFNISTLVETGTYLGDMIFAQRKNFQKILSIELQPSFYNYVKKRFSKNKNVILIQGDSGDILKILAFQNEFCSPCLFWLDGHYSAGNSAKGNKETPILEELNTILDTNQNHILLIDDARCFIGKNDYPVINEVKSLIINKFPKSKFAVADDIIRIEINTK